MREPAATTQLQLALDDITRAEVFPLLEKIVDFVDIVEVGTPLLMRYGVSVITEIKQHHPGLKVLSDAKIMDAAYYEAALSFDAGADYVTFLALTDDGSVTECVRASRDRGGLAVADMICVSGLAQRARRLAELGADIIAVHTGVDQQARGRTPLDDLRTLAASGTGVPLAVAGGISRSSAAGYLDLRPHILIVGSGITGAADVAAEAACLHEIIRGARR